VSCPQNGRRFHDPALPARGSLLSVLWWLLHNRRRHWPRWVEDPPQPSPPQCLAPHEAALTFVNHSTFLLQLGDVNVLTDPIWSERASPVPWAGPRRVRRPGLAFQHLPPVHLVLVSHNHYDHMDIPTLRRLQRRFAPLFVTGLGNRRYLRDRGVVRVVELDWWQTHHYRDDLAVTLTPARHFTRRGLFDQNRTLWGGFFLEAGKRRLFFAGDTGYGEHFTEVRERLGRPDAALLPIGAYEPRWFMKPVHMNPDEAVRAHRDLDATLSIGMHFGTFQLTDEGIDEPTRDLEQALRAHRIEPDRFRVPGFGETLPL
jgi:L-ascorbate metabolism protein UlaG (beta-lactamase superfamily)